MDWNFLKDQVLPKSTNIIKGIILALWIGLLVWFAGLAATGKASEYIIGFFKPFKYSFSTSSTPSPSESLRDYLSRYDYPRPPLESLIDLIVKNPSWMDRNIISKCPYPKEAEEKKDLFGMGRREKWETEQYDALFSRVDSIVQAIVSDRSLDPKDLSINIPEVPEVFKNPNIKQETSIKLPRVLASWIEEQRTREEEKKQRNSLVNTFFIIIVLGAFGSLIFLTKDYIELDIKTPLAAYFFRPILGMFLSMAIFVIDMLAHSVVSTADILKVRHETLYFLALAGGLLSEQAYAVVSVRAQAVLEKLKEKVSDSDIERK